MAQVYAFFGVHTAASIYTDFGVVTTLPGLQCNHEQINAKIKCVRGATGLSENDASLAKWLIAGPEVSRMVEEFEDRNRLPEWGEILEHHDSNASAQKHFTAHIKKIDDVLAELENPFLYDSIDQ